MRKLAFCVMLAMALTACGGSSGGPAADPVGAVNNLLNAVKAKQFTTIAPMICAAKRDSLSQSLNPMSALGSAAPGVNVQSILDAMTIDYTGLSVTQVSQNGDSAVVAIKGQLAITIDPAKMKDVVKTILAAAGQPTDDATIQQMLPLMTSAMASTKAMDSQVNVVKENGAWLVCDSIGA